MYAKTRQWKVTGFSLCMIHVLCVRNLCCTWTPKKLKDVWAVVQLIVAARTMLTTMPLCSSLGFGQLLYFWSLFSTLAISQYNHYSCQSWVVKEIS